MLAVQGTSIFTVSYVKGKNFRYTMVGLDFQLFYQQSEVIRRQYFKTRLSLSILAFHTFSYWDCSWQSTAMTEYEMTGVTNQSCLTLEQE